jgi:DNA-directed RNA polymerase subunit RPC12/RpoP
VNPSYHSQTVSATWVKFADYGLFRGAGLLALLFLACNPKVGWQPETRFLSIAGSSMEPRFHGERLLCKCHTCRHEFDLATDSVDEQDGIRCPRCWGQEVVATTIASDIVRVVPIDEASTIARYDCVVIEEPNSGRLEVKRVIGLPNESIRFVGGDVWVNGDHAQKSAHQFLDHAVLVAEWEELSGVQLEQHKHYRYSNRNLWPQTGVERQPHPSPILDDYPMIASESRWPSVVRDIGLGIQLEELPSEPIELAIEIATDQEQSVMAMINLDSKHRVGEFNLPNEPPAARTKGRSANEVPTITIAYIDGRIVASFGKETLGFQMVRQFSQKVTTLNPVGIVLSKGSLSIQKARIFRDLYYRGPNGEEDFALRPVLGYHLLGDSVPNSYDSRQRWPNGVPREWILGRIENR